MEIIIDPHTLQRASERGASKKEIKDTLQHGKLSVAKNGRKSKAKIFMFDRLCNGKYYEQKKIEVIFVEKDKSLITVTVYVYYGKFEKK